MLGSGEETSSTNPMKTRSLLLLVIGLICCPNLGGQEIQIHTRDGDILVSPQPVQPLQFTKISDADTKARVVPWNEIDSLHLIEYQLSQQSQRVEELLAQLSDPDYARREAAEELLSDSDQFGPFEALIKNYARNSANFEISYRLTRVLEKLEDYAGPTIGNFDELLLKNGETIHGDAGEFSLSMKILDRHKKLDRGTIKQISIKPKEGTRTESTRLKMETFNRPFPDFYQNDDKLISFETLKNGEPVPGRGENANTMFVSHGLKFQTEEAGYVGTLWYPFKLCPIETGKKCVCPFDETSRVAKRLWGTTLITFCPPDQPGISAGVRKFGLFLEKVEHSRDIVVEAYNAIGQMIGMVEASDQKCVFAGFESNELITCIRISKNSDLPKLSRRVDPSYAMDCVTYDGLEKIDRLYDPVSGSVDSKQIKVGLKNGNLLNVSQLSVDQNRLSFISKLTSRVETCDLDDVRSFNFLRSRRFAAGENDYLMVQLADSSVVKTEIDSWKQPFDFLDTQLSEKEILGVWSGRNPARMPGTNDLQSNRPVVVYPSCRILARNFELFPGGFSWNRLDSNKRIQEVKLFDKEGSRVTREESEDPDLTPNVGQIEFRDSDKIPTLWLREPTTADLDRGYVFLTDGQYFVLGGKSGFNVSRLGSKNVEIEFGKSKKLYPMTRISSIKLPPNHQTQRSRE